jgi:hypothetical protein
MAKLAEYCFSVTLVTKDLSGCFVAIGDNRQTIHSLGLGVISRELLSRLPTTDFEKKAVTAVLQWDIRNDSVMPNPMPQARCNHALPPHAKGGSPVSNLAHDVGQDGHASQPGARMGAICHCGRYRVKVEHLTVILQSFTLING